ncbi:MAG: type I DNA topoisomerase [Rickettsiales bacterium]|jgi:DNA topoisomerase-1|nr:type I DNA topoisomerase [Rickettsiales bacterium]
MNLLIVESPAKSKTIEKYLGADFKVMASIGHVRDLLPEDGSVDPNNNFKMIWQIMPDKEKQIKAISDALKKSDTLYLATDQDREGEAIAWHLYDILSERGLLVGKKVYRITFNEITKRAVQAALESPREIDQSLVNAYLGRRALDYLMGFNLSPVLWRKVPGAKSAGRVQSAALALLVAREREIEEFNPVEYWSVDADVKAKGGKFNAKLSESNGKKIDKLSISTKDQVDEILSALVPNLPGVVKKIEKKQTSRRPAAPFTTSTLQQEASRKLHFGAQRTMRAAQKLYEKGFITYMRTDAVNLSEDALSAIRSYISSSFGAPYLPAAAIRYANKSKNAQEAHEAVRPTDCAKTSVIGLVEHTDEEKLYELIWKRTLACQMTDAKFDAVAVDIIPAKVSAVFRATGSTQTFDGFLKLYQEGEDDKEDENEVKIPPLTEGEEIVFTAFNSEQHFTMPPPRFTEATLVKKLEELGIGRPSTYATILGVIVDREYAKLEKQRFFATEKGWIVAAFLGKYFEQFVASDFTAGVEDNLDQIAESKAEWTKVLRSFWDLLSSKIAAAKEVSTADVMTEINKILSPHLFKDGGDICPECKKGKVGLRLGKFGAFLGCGNYPDCKYIKNIGDNAAPAGGSANKDLGDGVFFKVGRYGPYVEQGDKRASAKNETSETITLEKALELLSTGGRAEAEELGDHSGTPIKYHATGKFGPYISWGKVNASVKTRPELEDAIEIIEKKKLAPKKFFKKK